MTMIRRMHSERSIIFSAVLYRNCTAEEVLAILEHEGNFDIADIHVEPPSDGEETEVDGGDEDFTINSLSGRYLRAAAHVTLHRGEEESCICEEAARACRTRKRKQMNWKRSTDLTEEDKTKFTLNPVPSTIADRDQSPAVGFEQFFDENLCTLIVEQSKLYANQKENHSFSFSVSDVRLMTAILVLSGYNPTKT